MLLRSQPARLNVAAGAHAHAPLSRCRRTGVRAAAAAAAASAEPAAAPPVLLPLTAREQIEQAVAASRASGARLQRVELLLPVNQRAQSFTNTDALDYPASAQTVHDVAAACAGALLRSLAGEGPLASQRVGDANDPCAVWATADGTYAAVVTPSAEHLPAIRKLADKPGRTTLFILNAQWNEAGQARR
jgi:hypothetical protein